MSLKKSTREAVKQYIAEKVSEGDKAVAKKTSDAFNISLNSVYRYIREMKNDGILDGEGRSLSLNRQVTSASLTRAELTSDGEGKIFADVLEPLISGYRENVRRIWIYSFEEMVNNVIDHSGAGHLEITIVQDILRTSILIADDGVGIFKKIRDHFGFPMIEDAVAELFKGKLTTDSKRHSGEGIFFTSRVMDSFAVLSGGSIFTHNQFEEIQRELGGIHSIDGRDTLPGTVVFLSLSNHTEKHLKDVFDRHADVDGGFTKTSIRIRNVFPSGPISRSQAKRLYARLEQFEVVELDFAGVDFIAQGFAHELFVVFPSMHPGVTLNTLNAGEEVLRMIRHVCA